MRRRRTVRDKSLIDAIESTPARTFEGSLWRVVRADRDPLRGSSAGGRWDDGTFEVLYTSAEMEGSVAEIYFHLMRGQPVFPSRMKFKLYRLSASLERAFHLPDLDALEALGVKVEKYGQLSYEQREEEYRRPQEIAEAAHFLDFDGLVAPSARWPCENVILFTDRVAPDRLRVVEDHGLIDWDRWKQRLKAS